MSENTPSVLVIEDNPVTLDLFCEILKDNGYNAYAAADGSIGLDILSKENPDLVLLDIMLPGIDGFEVCEKIRSSSQAPIIMVTAKGDDEDKVDAFAAGADDYITKPFSQTELVARIGAAIRRPYLGSNASETVIHCQDLSINISLRQVFVKSKRIKLSSKEYTLLSHIATNSGRVVTHEELLQLVWGDDATENYHLLQANIERIRQKLNDKQKPAKYFHNEHGKGYVMITQSQ